MKYIFPPPPNFHGDQIGPDVPSRLKCLEILSCDGSGVCVRFEYDNADQSDSHRISMSLPASLKLASELSAAVNEYLYNTGEEVDTEQAQT